VKNRLIVDHPQPADTDRNQHVFRVPVSPKGIVMFEHIPAYQGDPILSLNEDFQLDPRANKVNLSIGIYFDDAGKLPVMSAVRNAENALLDVIAPRPYLPMAGYVPYRDVAQALVFGDDRGARTAGRIATLQTIGGSGALKVGADFLKRYFAT